MSNDTLDLLRSLRAATPEADDDLTAHVLGRITASPRRPPARKRKPLLAQLVTGAAAAVAVTLVVLAAPWRHGPASVPAAEAARVLQGTLAVLTPRAGWVFHERVVTDEVVPGTSKRRRGVREIWVVNGPPRRYRAVTTDERFTGTVESGGITGNAVGYVYDRQTNALYRSRFSGRFAVIAPPPSPSWRSSISHDIRAKRAKVVRRTVTDGRPAYEIKWLVSQSPYTLYVDASTYAPIEVDYPALGFIDNYWWSASDHFTAYEYLPPTQANLALADITRSHRGAQLAPATGMPKELRAELHPGFYVSNGR